MGRLLGIGVQEKGGIRLNHPWISTGFSMGDRSLIFDENLLCNGFDRLKGRYLSILKLVLLCLFFEGGSR